MGTRPDTMARQWFAGDTVTAQGLTMTITHCAKSPNPRPPSAKKGTVRPGDVWILRSNKRSRTALDDTEMGWLLNDKPAGDPYWSRVKLQDLNWATWGATTREEVTQTAITNNNVGKMLANKYVLPPNIYAKCKATQEKHTSTGWNGQVTVDVKQVLEEVALEEEEKDKEEYPWDFANQFPKEYINDDYPFHKMCNDMMSQANWFEHVGKKSKQSMNNETTAKNFWMKLFYDSVQRITPDTTDLSVAGIQEGLLKNTEYQADKSKALDLQKRIGEHACALKYMRFSVLGDTEDDTDALNEISDSQLAF